MVSLFVLVTFKEPFGIGDATRPVKVEAAADASEAIVEPSDMVMDPLADEAVLTALPDDREGFVLEVIRAVLLDRGSSELLTIGVDVMAAGTEADEAS